MKNLILFTILFSIAFSGPCQDINGIWKDSTSSAFTNCHAVFTVKNDSVRMTHYLEFNGTPFAEYGIGIKNKDSLVYNVTVTKGIPGWSTAGIHRLKVSKDGNSLRGKYHDNKGNTGIIVFKRKH